MRPRSTIAKFEGLFSTADVTILYSVQLTLCLWTKLRNKIVNILSSKYPSGTLQCAILSIIRWL